MNFIRRDVPQTMTAHLILLIDYHPHPELKYNKDSKSSSQRKIHRSHLKFIDLVASRTLSFRRFVHWMM